MADSSTTAATEMRAAVGPTRATRIAEDAPLSWPHASPFQARASPASQPGQPAAAAPTRAIAGMNRPGPASVREEAKRAPKRNERPAPAAASAIGSSLSPPPRAGRRASADHSPAARGSICSTVIPASAMSGWSAATSMARACMTTVPTIAPIAKARDMRQPLRS